MFQDLEDLTDIWIEPADIQYAVEDLKDVISNTINEDDQGN